MRKRQIKKNLYLSIIEDKRLKEKCEELGVSESEYFRSCINDFNVDYKLRKKVFDLILELRKIGTNINQIAYVANRSGYISDNKYSTNYKELLNIIEKIRELLRC